MPKASSSGPTGVWDRIREKLEKLGVDLEDVCGDECGGKVKVVCVAPDLSDTVREMGEKTRDQVVMVRVDEDTCQKLDAWVETGAVKSRSEAAALFIREGLGVRRAELDQLESALGDVQKAKNRLREQAKKVFGIPDEGAPPAG